MHSTQNVLPHEMSQLKKENAMTDDDYILNHFDQIMDAISSGFFSNRFSSTFAIGPPHLKRMS